jgi:phytanoyl-CoA hydroxylase
VIELKTPRGLPVRVPEELSEDPSARFVVGDAKNAKEYYERYGYVILHGLFSAETCDQARNLWNDEIKPHNGHIYRQATAKAERHVKNKNGWVMNPILNLQSVDPRHFPDFRKFSTHSILSHGPLHDAFAAFLGESPKIVQSMYFEGNSATWEHQDSYYLDSEVPGEMCAAWISLDDIAPTAGRFFICPGSHKIRLQDHSLYNNVAEHHDAYILSVVEEIRNRKFDIRAPLMSKGDVLFWNAWTIHGSLDSQDATHSRSSITCHAIPRSRKFLQHQTNIFTLKTDKVNATEIYRPKDLASWKNRFVFSIESHFPSVFYWLKKKAVIHALRAKSR